MGMPSLHAQESVADSPTRSKKTCRKKTGRLAEAEKSGPIRLVVKISGRRMTRLRGCLD